MNKWLFFTFVLIGSLFAPGRAIPQVVGVTLRLDTNVISVGGATTLRVFAQVIPSIRPNADQIFSWYVDVLNTNGSIASANYASMVKNASDNIPEISSSGFNDGANRRAIYDTFLNFPGAGVASPVELMAIPVTGSSTGQTRFKVQAGSGVPELSSDFLVAPISGDVPLTGGDYSAATADLRVVSEACAIRLQIAPLTAGAPGQRLLLSFTPCPGFNHTVEYREALNDAGGWHALPAAPHNSGSVIVTNSNSQRFYRVSTTSGSTAPELRLSIAALTQPGGAGQRLVLSYPTVAGHSYTIEVRNDLSLASAWQTLPGGPFNSGSVTITNTGPPRFFRVFATP